MLMRHGHFDYGNGFHGRVYLNPHQLFRHPSTIWRLAQDLLDVLPAELLEQTEVVAGPATGGALLAHTLAGLLDGRRALTHPPCSFAPFTQRRRRHELSSLARSFYAQRRWRASACCLPTTCGIPGRRSQRCAELVRQAGGMVLATVEICDRMEAIVDAGVPNYALAEYPAPENYPAADCPMCKGRRADHDASNGYTDTDERRYRAHAWQTVQLQPVRSVRRLEQLYQRLQPRGLGQRSGPPRPAVRRPAGSRDRRLLRGGAGVRPRGERAATRSTRCSAIMGPRPAAFVRGFDPAAPHPELRAMVHRWTRGEDLVALLWILRQMLERAGSIERSSSKVYEPDDEDVGAALDSFSARALALDLAARLRAAVPRAPGRLLLLSAAVGRQRLQAAEPVPAVDGPARRSRPRRLDRDAAVAADRAARHARHPARPLPPADALHDARVADGRRHHRVAARARSGRSGALRFFALPRRHDERLRLRPAAGRYAMSAEGTVPPARASRLAARSAALTPFVAAGVSPPSGRAAISAPPHGADRRSRRRATRVAFVREARCGHGRAVSRSLWLGTNTWSDAARGPSLPAAASSATRSPGRRTATASAFLVNGYQLRIFDAETRKPVGAGEPHRPPTASPLDAASRAASRSRRTAPP